MTPTTSGRFRCATRADLDALLECDTHAANIYGQRRAQIESAIDRDQCTIWEEEGQICGFVLTLPQHFYGRDFVDLLVVSESHRREGIGRSLLRMLENSVSEIWISTNESNVAMRGLLASEGWQFSGTLWGLDEGDPELVFYKRRMNI